MLWVATIGLVMTVVAVALAGRRALFLYRLATSGQPAPERIEYAKAHAGAEIKAQLVEVFGQRKLLKWTPSGTAHFFVMWAFFILATVYLEAYGALLQGAITGTPDFHIPIIGSWPILGFLQDFIAVAALIGLIVFAAIRIKNSPKKLGRASRFSGSHLGGAWVVLFMIFNVIWTMFLFRGAAINTGNFPYASGAFASEAAAAILPASEVLEGVGLLLHIGVMLVFLVIVVNSKHLHIFTAPLNVLFSRRPDGMGAAQEMRSGGKVLDFEEADPEVDVFGRGKIEDTTWKGFLDFYTCTECGRCQSQCPAWNTDKPLSPKMLILDQRDHAFKIAPYLLMGEEERAGLPQDVLTLLEKPLVGEDGVIHPDVLWSCTNCGACVEQCPVDIEHIDHILDMRRYQVMIESEFPSELGVMFRNLENKGNPWGQNNNERMGWAKDLDFEVPVTEGEIGEDVEYLFWIGCAGAFDENAKKTVRATAELLHIAGVNFTVLGKEETCTGDPARRAGNEFLFQLMATQTVETLNSAFSGREQIHRKIVTTCPHCMNTLGREYPDLDGHYEVVHHTQLLNKLVREKKLTPVKPADGGSPITYHDPCYLGRHNKVYEPPRELVGATQPQFTEMPRHADRSLCCGAGGARMWMEEKIGKRVNLERVDEALGTGANTIATGCPFCRTMITDGLDQRQSEDQGAGVTVRDVSQLLLESVKRGDGAAAEAESAPQEQSS